MEFLDLPAARCASGTVTFPARKVFLTAPAAGGFGKGADADSRPARLRRYRPYARSAQHLGVQVEQLTLSNTASPAAAGSSRLNMPIYSRQRRHRLSSPHRRPAFSGGFLRLRGVPRMHERPIGDLVDALRQLVPISPIWKPRLPTLLIKPAQIIDGQRIHSRRCLHNSSPRS